MLPPLLFAIFGVGIARISEHKDNYYWMELKRFQSFWFIIIKSIVMVELLLINIRSVLMWNVFLFHLRNLEIISSFRKLSALFSHASKFINFSIELWFCGLYTFTRSNWNLYIHLFIYFNLVCKLCISTLQRWIGIRHGFFVAIE